jgi:hypothetical protein
VVDTGFVGRPFEGMNHIPIQTLRSVSGHKDGPTYDWDVLKGKLAYRTICQP